MKPGYRPLKASCRDASSAKARMNSWPLPETIICLTGNYTHLCGTGNCVGVGG